MFVALESAWRLAGIATTSTTRIFRITNGADLQYPGRKGANVVDLYASNPRGYFDIDLQSQDTRAQLEAMGFKDVSGAALHHPAGLLFRYNSRGFREREPSGKDSRTWRVVFVGDSFTEGQGVREADSFVRLTEGLLARSAQDSKRVIEAWNFGVRGHDLPALGDLVDEALTLGPDVVILAMVLNDGERSPSLAETWPTLNDAIMVREKPLTGVWKASRLLGWARQRWIRAQVSRETVEWYRAIYSDENRDGWMRTRADLQRMKKSAAEHGSAFGVALWPLMAGLESKEAYPFLEAHNQIRRGCERAQIPFLDLAPSLFGVSADTYWVHEGDLHPNEIAHARVAPSLAQFASTLAPIGPVVAK